LEEYDDHVQYYSILSNKQQMEDSNVEPNEWWKLAKAQFKKKWKKIWLHP
jgi:hypothetical protein